MPFLDEEKPDLTGNSCGALPDFIGQFQPRHPAVKALTFEREEPAPRTEEAISARFPQLRLQLSGDEAKPSPKGPGICFCYFRCLEMRSFPEPF